MFSLQKTPFLVNLNAHEVLNKENKPCKGSQSQCNMLSAVVDTLCKEGSLKKKPLGFIRSLIATRASNVPKLDYTAVLEVCIFYLAHHKMSKHFKWQLWSHQGLQQI